MFIHNLDPIFLNLGLIQIKWYSLSYLVGIIFGWWFGKKILAFKRSDYDILPSNKNFDDLISYLIISIIIGGRIGYIIFYNLNFYLKNPLEILKIWEGGMSFHGALIGVILGCFYFAKFKKKETFIYLDIIACVSPVGLFFGRMANFINGELYGIPSNVYWSVIFPKIDNLPRHPSQIYEALLEGVLLFLIISYFTFKKKTFPGYCSFLFLIFYGILRLFAERFREPDIQIGYLFNSLSVGSILSIIMIIAGLIMFFINKKNAEIK